MMAVPLFISVYILISLHLDSIDSGRSSRDTKVYIHSMVQMQRAMDDLNSDLSRVTLHRDFLIEKINRFLNLTSKRGNWHESREKKILLDLPFMFQEQHFETLESLIRNDYLLTCDQIGAIQLLGESWKKNDYATLQLGLYGFQEVFVVKKAQEIDNCMKNVNIKDCQHYANYQLMKEILILQQLQDPNIAKLLGVCMTVESLPIYVSYVIEGGKYVNFTQLKQLSWNKKITVSLHYLPLNCNIIFFF